MNRSCLVDPSSATATGWFNLACCFQLTSSCHEIAGVALGTKACASRDPLPLICNAGFMPPLALAGFGGPVSQRPFLANVRRLAE